MTIELSPECQKVASKAKNNIITQSATSCALVSAQRCLEEVLRGATTADEKLLQVKGTNLSNLADLLNGDPLARSEARAEFMSAEAAVSLAGVEAARAQKAALGAEEAYRAAITAANDDESIAAELALEYTLQEA